MAPVKIEGKALATKIYRIVLRCLMQLYLLMVWVFSILPPYKRSRREKLEVLFTGTFYSDQWLITHLRPLALSKEVAVVRMVAVTPVPEMEGVEAIYPPDWLRKSVGSVPSRLLMFCYVAIKTRPDIIAGFHILINGLFCVLLAKMLGARSLYVCGGGPREVLGGGYTTENRIFNRIEYEDRFIEKQLVAATNQFDYVITMGTSAIEYFKQKGVDSRYEIIAGGFSDKDFFPKDSGDETYDLVLVGRLSEVKRVDIFLNAIANYKNTHGNISAVVVGDGPDREELEALASKLGVAGNVTFAGWQQNVGDWLRRSKIFVLTSESEGLSQALIQGCMCGLPAVVTDVGDLGDLVDDGNNGFLVKELDPAPFVSAFHSCLESDASYQAFSKAAIESSEKFKVPAVANHWDQVLAERW